MALAKFTYIGNRPIKATFESGVGTKDHNKLYNRDLPDQHPISAITGLQEALDDKADISDIPTKTSDLENDIGYITGITSSDVVSALGYTPYNSTNPNGYITNSALDGYATQNWVENKGYLTEIPAEYVTDSELTAKGYQTAADVETAITSKGYTTMSAVEAKGYITNAALVGYATENYVDTGLNGKQDTLTQTQLDAVNSGANTTNIGQIATNTSGIADINALIPNQATSSNQLADKDFVNSSINSMAAFYITSDVAGDPFATRAALIAGPYYFRGQLRTPTQNDYALVSEDETHDDLTSRYMYDGGQWVWQYTLNNTRFTQAQIDAINSGITDGLVAKISTNETAINNHITDKTNPHEVTKAQVGLSNVDNTSDLNKPISTATQTALNSKQDTISDLATIRSGAALGVTAVQPSDLATVATSGNYDDLSNKPTIPAAQVNADWNATSGVARILNKPTIPTVPTNVSAFTNDTGYITNSALTGYATENYVDTELAIKQDTLVSGTNIKTINNTSILGSGNIDIQGGGGSYTAGTGIDITNNVISVDSSIVTTNTAQDITARKTFFGEKAIYFKQNVANNKLGFTLCNNNNKEVGALEFRPNTIDSTPILTLNSPAPSETSVFLGNSYVGFRYWYNAINILAPFSTSFANKNFFIPVTFTNGTTTIESTSTDGSVDISSLLPTKTSDLTNDSGYITSSALTGYEQTSNKVTSISSSSTNTQYPSAKCVYDIVGDIETLINAL